MLGHGRLTPSAVAVAAAGYDHLILPPFQAVRRGKLSALESHLDSPALPLNHTNQVLVQEIFEILIWDR